MVKLGLVSKETWEIVQQLKREHWKQMKKEERLAKEKLNNNKGVK